MTLFRSEHYSVKHISMTGETRSSRPRAGSKRSSSELYRSDHDLDYDCYSEQLYDRVFDYQRVPVSMATISRDVTPPKRPRSSSSSSAVHRSSRERFQLRHRSRISGSSSSTAKLKMEELQSIKKELTVIKVQIDELLDSLDEMDRQRRDQSEGSVTCSSYPASGGSTAGSPRVPSPFGRPRRDRESPEPGEASDDNSSQVERPEESTRGAAGGETGV
ncbi:RNA-binding Raly-like protein isoform X1 [Alosa sapidissima]|uniref:RNA-binding Raly-like protein isoform X1 n=2 Tax=Alosa sapidissima TaxID=34773 RepID=UPI001C087750|nr:RNA-binding Raly-like protein isoform X1 [Alosa sapidissima]